VAGAAALFLLNKKAAGFFTIVIASERSERGNLQAARLLRRLPA